MSKLSLTPENLDSEKAVVLEERKLTVDNSPEGAMFEELLALAFKAHTYRSPVIGWESAVQRLTLEDCRNYYKTFYAPNNAFIVAAGDFVTHNLIDLIKKQYGPIPRQSLNIPKIPREPPQIGTRKSTLNMNAQLPAILMAFHVPEATHSDVWALDILQMILATGESSRLYRSLVYEKQIAASLSAGFPWHADPYIFYIYVQAKPVEPIEKIESIIFDQLENLKSQGVSTEELQKGKNILRMELTKRLETLEGKGEQIGLSWFFFDVFDDISFMIDKYKEVNKEQIGEVVHKYFQRNNVSIVYLNPIPTKQPYNE
jgi:predicted Zn-dependent peptidase